MGIYLGYKIGKSDFPGSHIFGHVLYSLSLSLGISFILKNPGRRSVFKYVRFFRVRRHPMDVGVDNRVSNLPYHVWVGDVSKKNCNVPENKNLSNFRFQVRPFLFGKLITYGLRTHT